MSIQEMTVSEIDEVNGGVTSGQVLNAGAGIAAVGAAAFGAVGLAAASPVLVAAGAAYGLVSAGMWAAGALSDIGYFKKVTAA
ncbi:hypothetical protein [Janthinobacterium lividum]|uniref:hypothetical protein n=1 Tax=Janthinobacterium lividum TaxID=29581 RepID=UPI0011131663|nr:hypothetical protein [Janthinobacterium lividum]MCC7717335.1 hypothetical protein [Janthinobacterium lividum]WQE31821.1 hypothetical protein U0004_29870 [Janthinobacterium lividum]